MKDTRKPVYLLAGGRGTPPESSVRALREAFALAGPKPSVAYIGAASGDDRKFFGWIGAMLKTSGAGEVRLAALVSDEADVAASRRIIAQADVVFVSGGDVEEGMRVLRRRRMLPFLRRLYEGGKLFCGVSAGSIMLAAEWIRWRNPDDDSTAERFDCLNLAPLRCDTHSEAEKWVELRALLALCDRGTTGYGIRSGACLVVDSRGSVRVSVGAVDRFTKAKDAAGKPKVMRA